MQNFDWSKAPKGYDFWVADRYGISVDGWHRLVGDRYIDQKGRFWSKEAEKSGRIAVFERPKWENSEALPPVGTACEIALSEVSRKASADLARYIEHDGKVALILGHHDVGGAVAALYAVKIGDHFEYHSLIAGNFRRLRTPEEIAAEQRKRAIDAMQRIVSSGDPHYGRKVCEALYDAGCRLPSNT